MRCAGDNEVCPGYHLVAVIILHTKPGGLPWNKQERALLGSRCSL